ncbi:S41 family peptidase [Qipengyuania sp. MTN3-11]|uniref:S41 family peptidase n=1 Tax=Qipengyuania sp. MTN3-11 TaxID=3056557 RepID=UPI0036F278F8
MSFGRTAISSIVALSLAACGGGGSGDQPTSVTPTPTSTPTPGPAPTPTPVSTCSLAARQQFALEVLNEWYLFPDLLDTSVNPASFGTVQDYLDALVAPARAQSKDRFFTYITSIEEENELINSGSSAGFGIRLGYDTVNNRVVVLEAFESAPAFPAGIDRGTELLSINGASVAVLMASGGPQAVVDALGPTDPGVTRTLRFRDVGGVERSATITKTEFSLDPISDRYGVRTFTNNGTSVGYINLRTFIVADAEQQLRAAFQQFRSAGISQIILDLRYNGGGLVSVAEVLGDLMLRDNVGEIFSRTVLRPSKSAENSTEFVMAQPQAVQATKLAVIGGGGTASASELVTNSMIPYLGNNMALVGANTFGKPVGQFAFDRSACDDRLRAVTFKTVNREGNGEYFTGLASVVPNTCAAEDGFLTPLGDVREESIAAALQFLRGGSCVPISRAQTRGLQSVGSRKLLLQPDRPNAAQVNIPGLF